MPYADPAKQREYQRTWVAVRRRAFFADKTCEWCGSTDDLELHHREPGKKVAHAIWSWGGTQREAEIAKCIVLCRFCHDRAHAQARRVEAELTSSHGTIRCYWRGCRCDPCRAARKDYKPEMADAR